MQSMFRDTKSFFATIFIFDVHSCICIHVICSNYYSGGNSFDNWGGADGLKGVYIENFHQIRVDGNTATMAFNYYQYAVGTSNAYKSLTATIR